MQPAVRADAKLPAVTEERLPVFVYGTLRPGGWNHEQWLAPLLAGPCRPASVDGMALHHHAGLPALTPSADGGSSVVGDLADLRVDGYDEALAVLDFLEDTATDHYRRVQVSVAVPVDGGGAGGFESAWVWVAGTRLAAELGPASLVEHGDWLRVPGAIR